MSTTKNPAGNSEKKRHKDLTLTLPSFALVYLVLYAEGDHFLHLSYLFRYMYTKTMVNC